MYGHKARNTMIAILKECPELKVGDAAVVTPKGYQQIADRLLIELWMRGFAVSGRPKGAKPPKGAPEDHKAWRDAKLAPKPAPTRRRRKKDPQADVEEASGACHADVP